MRRNSDCNKLSMFWRCHQSSGLWHPMYAGRRSLQMHRKCAEGPLAVHARGDTTFTQRRRLLRRQRTRSAAHDFARWLAMQRVWRGVDDCAQAGIAVTLVWQGMSAGMHSVSRRTVAAHVVETIGAATLVNPRGDEHAPRAREHSAPSHHCCG